MRDINILTHYLGGGRGGGVLPSSLFPLLLYHRQRPMAMVISRMNPAVTGPATTLSRILLDCGLVLLPAAAVELPDPLKDPAISPTAVAASWRSPKALLTD